MRQILSFLLLTLVFSFADESPLFGAAADEAKARQMMRLVANSPTFQALPQQCPLAIYKTKRNVSGQVGECSANLRRCLRHCEGGNRVACFKAARVIQKGKQPNANRATYRLFMEGCARGDGNACVNAGAWVKNTNCPGGKPPAAIRAKCQFTTYKRMCADRHPWGCFMTAKEYLRNNSYLGRSQRQHDTFMRRACAISETSGACRDGFK